MMMMVDLDKVINKMLEIFANDFDGNYFDE
jgi:hypothetical protein